MAVAVDGPATEAFLRVLWTRTFAQVAAVQEAWLEQAFVHRGRSLVERIYPNAEQRRRLYQFGFAPTIGRRFEVVAPLIRAELAAAADYGLEDAAERMARLVRMGELIRGQPGFGFQIRATVGDQQLLANWTGVLGWWMQAPALRLRRPSTFGLGSGSSVTISIFDSGSPSAPLSPRFGQQVPAGRRHLI